MCIFAHQENIFIKTNKKSYSFNSLIIKIKNLTTKTTITKDYVDLQRKIILFIRNDTTGKN